MAIKGQTDNIKVAFGKTSIPVLSKNSVIGDIFFNNASIIGWVAILFSFFAKFTMFKVKFGLRLRSVGEHLQATDTLGISNIDAAGVMISGALAGIRGAIYAQSSFC